MEPIGLSSHDAVVTRFNILEPNWNQTGKGRKGNNTTTNVNDSEKMSAICYQRGGWGGFKLENRQGFDKYVNRIAPRPRLINGKTRYSVKNTPRHLSAVLLHSVSVDAQDLNIVDIPPQVSPRPGDPLEPFKQKYRTYSTGQRSAKKQQRGDKRQGYAQLTISKLMIIH